MNNPQSDKIQSHINHLAERLWAGRASVFVGAGMSRNALPLSTCFKEFPLWCELSKKFSEKLYPGQEKSKNVLRLAEEYEAAFERDELNRTIIEEIPDNNFEPGDLHVELLKFPWNDVFTTNYDTLIEKAREHVIDRKYEVVYSQNDLPRRKSPRIIKLHGSFPSSYPFIITEEDYRTYPRKFAPFVNLVQTTLLESTLVLIGFSGDDPNFLEWTGWIRDNLGENAPPIFLCGVLNLSNSENELFRKRGVIAIDLKDKVLNEPQNLKHKKALEWFFKELNNQKPYDALKWAIADESNLNIVQSLDDLSNKYDPGKRWNEVKEIDPQKVINKWKTLRLAYPGWLIVPKKNRKNLFDYSVDWCGYIDAIISNIEPPIDLQLLFEYDWRIKKTLNRHYSNITKHIENVLNRYNPDPSLIDNDKQIKVELLVTPEHQKYKELNWSEIRNNWISLAFSFLRELRFEENKEKYDKWISRLEPFIEENPEWQSEFNYQQCLYYLSRLDEDCVSNVLNQWPDTLKSYPYGEIKRAGILAEIGDIDGAYKTAMNSLNRIRYSLSSSNCDDLNLISQEAWSVHFIKYLLKEKKRDDQITNNDTFHERYIEYSDRLDLIEKRYNYSPAFELEAIERDIKGKPNKQDGIKKRHEFDLGKYRISHNLFFDKNNPISNHESQKGFEYLNVFEGVGLPFRIRNGVWFNLQVIDFVFRCIPIYAITCIFRSLITNEDHFKKNASTFFSRIRTAILPIETVMWSYDILFSSLEKNVKYLKDKEDYIEKIAVNKIKMCLEILSRLSIRLSEESLIKLLNFVLLVSKNREFQNEVKLHESYNNLLKRILVALKEETVEKYSKQLLSFPIPNQDFGLTNYEYREWPETARLRMPKKAHLENLEVENIFKKLINNLECESYVFWKEAIARLDVLNDLNLLDQNQVNQIAVVLWGKYDPEKTDLGIGVFSHSYYFLKYPKTNSEETKTLLKEALLNLIISDKLDNALLENVYELTKINYRSHLSEIDLLDWSNEEMVVILDKFVLWWEKNKKEYVDKKNISIIASQFFIIVFQKLGKDQIENAKRVKNIYQEISQKVSYASGFYPSMIRYGISDNEEAVYEIKKGFKDQDTDNLLASCQAIIEWYYLNEYEKGKYPIPNELLSYIISIISLPNYKNTTVVLKLITIIIECKNDIFTEAQIKNIYEILIDIYKSTELPNSEVSLQEPELDDNELLERRTAAANLAHKLYKRAEELRQEIPDILNKWKSICNNESTPELRFLWTK